jgi:hypothetical protein
MSSFPSFRIGAGLSILIAFVLLFSPSKAVGQDVSAEISSQSDGSLLVDFIFNWRTSLAEFVDSAGVEQWSYEHIDKITGEFRSASKTVELPSYASPTVTVLRFESDEIDVPVLRTSSAVAQNARVEGLGMYRKKPVVDVVVPVYSLDADRSVLVRSRRISVLITPGEAAYDAGLAAQIEQDRVPKGSSVLNSALSTGQIFRLSITEPGVYRINRALLTALGLNPDAIDPNSIEILGNGGKPLPALNALSRISDVAAIPAQRMGGGDGNFGSADEILFYANGPSGWNYVDGSFEHFVHPYSNDNAVFMKVGAAAITELEMRPLTASSAGQVFQTTTGRMFVDLEERVWSREHGSGSDWMSNTIRSGGSRSILTNTVLPGLLAGVVNYEARVAIASNPRATVAMISSGTTLAQRTASLTTTQRSEDPTASISVFSFDQTVAAAQPLNLTMQLLNQSNEPEASLDWLRVTYSQDLVKSTGPLFFTTRPGVTSDQTYQLRGFASTPTIWDITEGRLAWSHEPAVSSGTISVRISASDSFLRPRDLVAFLPTDVKSLTASQASPVSNQDLHGVTGFPELVIVAPTGFLPAAERLASHRRAQNMEVAVVTQTQVFNEFSGGVPDMRAVRDYMRFLYTRAPADRLPKYLLLLGDGHYDFRGISGFQQALSNQIFPYETDESVYTDGTFTSDDYFGLLDVNEGVWRYTSFTEISSERVDIGIGRFPVQNLAEAEMMVDKVISYEDPSTFGSWRSRYTAIADDGPTGLSGVQNDNDLHLTNVDQVVELVAQTLYPEINLHKIYAETYQRVFLNGFRIPEAKKEISAAINRGSLVVNYSGHGGPNGLAQEEIFTKDDALALTNKDKLAVFITATCSFGWWDLEEFQSGAEALLLNPNGGAVAMLTTVRLVYTSGGTTTLNAGLNREINKAMFELDEDGRPRRLGDILALTKNTEVGLQGNSRKFNLLGDPSMRIGLPEHNAVVERLNSVPLQSAVGQMKALELVKIEGEIRNHSGGTNTAFNGNVDVTVYDAERQVPILVRYWGPNDSFRQREELLWRGQVKAVNGKYEAVFVVPKDISYSNEPGRISVYASDVNAHAIGYSENFIVGGTTSNLPNDTAGPDLRVFINDSTFVSGQTVTGNAELLVRLFDESGINTVGTGVGHEMLMTLDGADTSAEDIGSGFVAEPNSYQRGTVRWPLPELSPGRHTLSVRAWDVLNNSSTAEISFNVANDEVLNVLNVYNYPNPMNRETRFVFEHNQPPGTSAEVEIRIYTLSGRPIRTITSDEALPGGILTSGSLQVFWDGKDDDFDRPATGIYLYRLRVVTNGSNGERHVSEHVDKLAIIR